MNPQNPSREELELRITMLLLGELPSAEAEALRQTISQDVTLKKLHDELQSTIGLVREVEKNPADAASENSALKLSDERRQKLLAHFQTPRPQESFWIRPMKLPSLIPVLVVVAIVAMLAALLLPALSTAKSRSSHTLALSQARQKALEEQMAEADKKLQDSINNKHVAAPAPPPASAPAVVTVAPEPVLAPPPAPQIVLPSTESPATVTTGSLADSGNGGVYSQPAVVYTTSLGSGSSATTPLAPTLSFGLQTAGGGGAAPAPEAKPADALVQDGKLLYESGKLKESEEKLNQALAKNPDDQKAQYYMLLDKQAANNRDLNNHPVDTQARMEQVEKVGVINGFAGVGGFSGGIGGGGGGGGGGGAGGPPPTSSAALAWNDSSVNRSRIENKPALPGEVSQPEFTAGAMTGLPAAGNLPDAMPEGKFPVTTDFASAEQVMSEKKFDGGNATAKGASRLRDTEPALAAKHGFYKITPLPGARAAVAGDESQAAPLAMGATMPPNAGPIVLPPAEMPAPPAGTPATAAFDFQTGAPAAGDREGGAVAGTLYRKTTSEEKDINGSVAPPVMAAPALPRSAVEKDKSGRMELALNGVNTDTGGTTFDTRKPADVMALDSLQTGLTKEDAAGLRDLMVTNGVTTANFQDTLVSTPALAETDRQTYEIEKRKLQDLEETHKMLNLKITANSIDAKIPTTSMVQITDAAEPNTHQTFWQGLWGEYASTAKIKVENDGPIINGFGQAAAQNQPYDPYFIQTTFEIMQSSAVLGKVVDDLHLDTAWANKNGGQKLTKQQAIAQLKSRLSLQPVKNTKLIAISVTSDKPEEAAKLANAVAVAYQNYRVANNQQTAATGLEVLQQQYMEESNQIVQVQSNLAKLAPKPVEPVAEADLPVRRPPANAPVPQPEILTSENAFSTFSLNVSDVSFKLAEASLEKGQMPDAASIRSEEFINAFDYRDPEAVPGQPMAFASERARYPFAHNRELLRFSIKTAAAGRPAGRALNLVLLLDNSGSMERADRVAIIREALRVLAGQLQPQDTVSVVTFARTARLWADGVAGDKAGETLAQVGDITPEGGTNLEEAMRLAYETAHRHYLANGLNRVVLLTDGAANLGNVDPAVLKQKVEVQRKQGIALDCFGIGFEGYDDDLLEQLSRNGDGRYAFINSPEEAGNEFAAKLAGALQIAAADVKVQVEFNPQRVISYRQIGYAKHQLTKEQFRDNTVDAAEIAAQEAGNALYTVETKPDGTGPVATVHVRYKVPGTTDYQEHSWDVAYEGNVPALEQASATMRLAGTASAFSEWLAISPFAQEVTPDDLLKIISGVPEVYGADERPKKLEWMIRQAKSLSGK